MSTLAYASICSCQSASHSQWNCIGGPLQHTVVDAVHDATSTCNLAATPAGRVPSPAVAGYAAATTCFWCTAHSAFCGPAKRWAQGSKTEHRRWNIWQATLAGSTKSGWPTNAFLNLLTAHIPICTGRLPFQFAIHPNGLRKPSNISLSRSPASCKYHPSVTGIWPGPSTTATRGPGYGTGSPKPPTGNYIGGTATVSPWLQPTTWSRATCSTCRLRALPSWSSSPPGSAWLLSSVSTLSTT